MKYTIRFFCISMCAVISATVQNSGLSRLVQIKGAPVLSVSWSADGKKLAYGTLQGSVVIVDAATGRTLSTLNRHSDRVWAVRWNPQGHLLASYAEDKMINIWSGEQNGTHWSLFQSFKDGVTTEIMGMGLTWSPNGKLVASLASDSVLKIWDIESAKLIQHLDASQYAIKMQASYALSWSRNGEYIAASYGRKIIVWSTKDWKKVTEFVIAGNKDIWSIAWSPDNRRLAAIADDGFVRIWDVKTSQLLHESKSHSGGTSRSLSWSPNGTRIAYGTEGTKVVIMDANTYNLLNAFSVDTATVVSVEWSPDSQRLAVGSTGGIVEIWRVSL